MLMFTQLILHYLHYIHSRGAQNLFLCVAHTHTHITYSRVTAYIIGIPLEFGAHTDTFKYEDTNKKYSIIPKLAGWLAGGIIYGNSPGVYFCLPHRCQKKCENISACFQKHTASNRGHRLLRDAQSFVCTVPSLKSV